MMFEYTSDYLAKKLRENWLTRSSEESVFNGQEQDDSLTNLNWLQTLNIHELASTGQPLSPPSTPPLPLSGSLLSNGSLLPTVINSSQKIYSSKYPIDNVNKAISSIEIQNKFNCTSDTALNQPVTNLSKHATLNSTTDSDNHSSSSSNCGIRCVNRQLKHSPLRCNNNLLNFNASSNSLQCNSNTSESTVIDNNTGASNTINSIRNYYDNTNAISRSKLPSNLNRPASIINPVFINNNDQRSNNGVICDNEIRVNTNYAMNYINNYNINNSYHSLNRRHNNNPLKIGHHYLQANSVQRIFQNDIYPLNLKDINLPVHLNTNNTLNANVSSHNLNEITEKNQTLFQNYDEISFQEKDKYRYDVNCKPMFKCSTLIYMAMNSLKKNKITLNDICQWIQVHFAFYRNLKDIHWQDVIRQHLTLNRCFQRVPRRKEEPNGRGDLWRIHPELQNQLIQNKIHKKYLQLWQNSNNNNNIISKLPDLLDFVEQQTSTTPKSMSASLQSEDMYQSINSDSSSIQVNESYELLDNLYDNLNECMKKRRRISSSYDAFIENYNSNYSDNNINNTILNDMTKLPMNSISNDITSQSNSSSSPALSDLYTTPTTTDTTPPPELLPEDTSPALLLENEYYLNAFGVSDLGGDVNGCGADDVDDELLRSDALHHSCSVYNTSPPKLIEQETCDDLDALFPDSGDDPYHNHDDDVCNNVCEIEETHKSDEQSINSIDFIPSKMKLNELDNRIVVELSKASGLNDIPPLDDLVDPLDLTIRGHGVKYTPDWWSNNLTESMTNFINGTLSGRGGGGDGNVTGDENIVGEHEDVEKISDDDDDAITSSIFSLTNDEMPLPLELTAAAVEEASLSSSTSLSPCQVTSSGSALSLPSTTGIQSTPPVLMTILPECDDVTSDFIKLPTSLQDYAFFSNNIPLTTTNNNTTTIGHHENALLENPLDDNDHLQQHIQHQRWIENEVNLDDLDNILGLC
ncbi:unnamed protein product [Trichobilharzia szidati]|nr:unnamed protein product [Trichobilharzia szidati]